MAEKPLRSIQFPNSEDVYRLKPNWDDVDNKPFYDVVSDTLTFDLDAYECPVTVMGMLFKVSDDIPTFEELNNGGSIVADGETISWSAGELSEDNNVVADGGIIVLLDSLVAVVSDSMVGVDYEGLTFSESGIYVMYGSDAPSITQLQINGYSFEYSIKIHSRFLSPKAITKDNMPISDWDQGVETELDAIKNRPFGVFKETVLKLDPNNYTGSVNVSDVLYKVSDHIIPIEQFINTILAGAYMVINGERNEFSGEILYNMIMTDNCSNIYISSYVVFVGENGAGNECSGGPFSGVVYPEPGIYFMYNTAGNILVTEFSINGYTFSETMKTLDIKYLPESHQFGNVIPTGSDTLTWDGDTVGRVHFVLFDSVNLYKMSDDVIPLDVMKQCTIETSTGLIVSGTSTMASALEDGAIIGAEYVFVVIPYDNYTIDANTVVAEKGLYFIRNESMFLARMTVSGYTGFPSIKKIDEQYLPDTVILYSEPIGDDNNQFYIHPTNDTSNPDTRMTTDEIERLFLSNRKIVITSNLELSSDIIITSYLVASSFGIEDNSTLGKRIGSIISQNATFYTAEYTPEETTSE